MSNAEHKQAIRDLKQAVAENPGQRNLLRFSQRAARLEARLARIAVLLERGASPELEAEKERRELELAYVNARVKALAN